MIFSFAELADLVIMIFAVGFIFSKFFPRQEYEPMARRGFWDDLKYGIALAVPSVVLHELAHKFTAVAFGAQAVLEAPVLLYLIALALVLSRFPVVFLVGGYVSIVGELSGWQSALVSLSGPLVNLAVWAFCLVCVKKRFFRSRVLVLAGRLNFFLFVFNMLPVPGFDGFGFFYSLIKAVF